MLTPPDGLTEQDLTEALLQHWGVEAGDLRYQPVGWGSHHWAAVDTGGTRWFVTVDDLRQRRLTRDEALVRSAERLGSALGAAAALRAHGADFVVAAVPDRTGTVVHRLGEHFAVAVHPYVDGESFRWGHPMSAGHRAGRLDMVVAVHAAPDDVRDLAPVDDFVIPHRDELESALRGDHAGDAGPFAARAAALVADHAGAVVAALATYDELVAGTRRTPPDLVLTHGEPHPGNTMLDVEGRWRLLDWDTARAAPPERDLWLMDSGDGSVLADYVAATGRALRPEVLELYRRRWDLADVAVDVARFRRPHAGTDEDAASFAILEGQVRAVSV